MLEHGHLNGRLSTEIKVRHIIAVIIQRWLRAIDDSQWKTGRAIRQGLIDALAPEGQKINQKKRLRQEAWAREVKTVSRIKISCICRYTVLVHAVKGDP